MDIGSGIGKGIKTMNRQKGFGNARNNCRN